MEKKYIYFQPQYVGEFICDSSKCNDTCCERGWNIDVDEATYKKYLQVNPKIAAQFEYNKDRGKYLLKKHPCPFLTDKKLCRLQLEYGEDFLSRTCRGYPRVTFDFGNFFERSLTLTCSLAAEMILFTEEPMKFELVEVSEKIHGGDKLIINPVYLDEKILTHIIEIQLAQISILQERTLSIDQRLIVLGFFLDRLNEIFSAEIFDDRALTKLIEAYESKAFLREQVPLMIRSINFDAKRFTAIMSDLMNNFYGKGKFTDAVSKIAEHDKLLSDFRKKFLNTHSIFLENFLVNELFMNVYPFRFEGQIIKNFGVFIVKYKIFELTLLLAALKNPVGKDNLIALADWFTSQFNHIEVYQRQIFNYLEGKDDILNLMDSLLEGSD
ncbi:MAG: flagellin lysine-N-methylase [Selenomonadaceae bacterium]|nr:flagellin lysine-N-methylase [Selenomonadaceae bacterium]